MLKNIICDYIDGFRWSRIRQVYQKGGWYTYLYFITVFPVFTGFYEKAEEAVTYYLVMMPILFCMFASPMHPMAMPKIMYLCPLDRHKRYQYISWSGYLHIIVPFLLGLLGILGLAVLGKTDFLSASGILINVTLMSVFCCGINRKGFGDSTPDGKRCFNMNSGWGVCETAGIMITMISDYCYSALLCCYHPVYHWAIWILLCFGILVQVPLAICYLKGWQGAVERALDYETAYR